MKKPIEVKKKLKKVTEYTACFAFLMFLQGVGAPMVFADATTAINAKFEILWNLSALWYNLWVVLFYYGMHLNLELPCRHRKAEVLLQDL